MWGGAGVIIRSHIASRLSLSYSLSFVLDVRTAETGDKRPEFKSRFSHEAIHGMNSIGTHHRHSFALDDPTQEYLASIVHVCTLSSTNE